MSRVWQTNTSIIPTTILEMTKKVNLSCIYQSPLDQKWPTIMTAVDIDCNYIKKWPTNTSMLFTTVLYICWVYISITTLKHVTQKYIPCIYWSLLFQEGSNRYICIDHYWLYCLQKLDQKVHISYILITLVSESDQKYI